IVPMFVWITATSFLPAGLSMAPFSGAALAPGVAAAAGVDAGEPCANASPTPITAHATRLAARTALDGPRTPRIENVVIVSPPGELLRPSRSEERRVGKEGRARGGERSGTNA